MSYSTKQEGKTVHQGLLPLLAPMGVLVCFLGLQAALAPTTSAEPANAEVPESSPPQVSASLLKSDYTFNYFEEKWRYEQSISKWQEVLSEMGVEHKLITDPELERGELEEFAILILPVALCLSEEERRAIRGFLSQGKGVMASSAIGTRSQDGEWAGWGFLRELTNSKTADCLVEDSPFRVAFLGNSPLSVGLRPGFRMDLWSQQKVAVTRAGKDAYWSDWGLRPQRTTEESDSDVAVAQGNYGKGRTVWFGFNVGEVAQDSVNQKALRRFLLNAIQWTGRVPISQAWYWPGNHQGAAIFTQDVEHLFQNAANAVKILREEGVPGTFFCVSDLAVDHQELVKTFAEIGEVGSHSDNHQVFKGQPFDLQLRRLKKSVTDLKEISGVEVKGLRPPEELLDERTLKAWATLGGEYIFGQPNYEPLVVPELLTVREDPSEGLSRKEPLVIIRRVVADDYAALVRDSLTDNEEILRLHKSDLDWIYDLSGLYVFAYHSNLYCLPDRVDILLRMVKYAKTLDLWFATAGDVSRWWRLREKVSTGIHSISQDRLLLSVENLSSESVTNLSVIVYLRRTPKTAEIRSNSSDIPSPNHWLEESKLVVHIESLQPNSVQTYTIKLG